LGFVWIELLLNRVNLFDGELVESGIELLEGELDALPQCPGRRLVRRHTGLQAVSHGYKRRGEALKSVLVSVGDVCLRAFANVVAFSSGAQPRIAQLLGLELGPF